MQGFCNNSALFWAPEKAGVRQPLLILFPFVGDHRQRRGCVTIPLLGRREGKGEAASSYVVPFVGDPWVCRAYTTVPPSWGPQEGRGEVGSSAPIVPSFGPREGRGEVVNSDFVPFVGGPRERRGCVALPPAFGPPTRQGCGRRFRFSSPLLGTPENIGVTYQFRPLWGPGEGRYEVATFDVVPLCSGPPRTQRYVAIPPSFGPPRRQG